MTSLERQPFSERLGCENSLLLLYVSAVSVVIVIIAICDMPRHEFSLCEHVYIHNMYMKGRKLWRKFRVKFPGQPVPNPSTIRRQAKRFTNV